MQSKKRRDPLTYSRKFREAVLSVFPGSERIRRMLEENSFSLGYSLSEGGTTSISPSLVVTLLEAGRADMLLRVAKDAEEKRQLYEMWKTEVYER